MNRHRPTLWALLGTSLALLIWTMLTLTTSALTGLDRLRPRPASPTTTTGQVLEVIAGTTWPGTLTVGLCCLAIWALRRRFRHLASALVVSSLLGWIVPSVLKRLIGRARPDSPFAAHFTSFGSSYPSTHAAMSVVVAVMVGAATATSRRSRTTQLLWRAAGAAFVVVVAADRLLMAAHRPTDIVAGWLTGLVVCSASLWACGVRTIAGWQIMKPLPPVHTTGGLAAVIYNPVKVLDESQFRRHVSQALTAAGWREPLWLTTTVDDPGWGMVATAIDQRVDRVLVAGGDGTVRVVCSGLAHTGIGVGVIPAGTANLLCRNLGIPMDEAAALQVALTGDPYAIDLIKVRTDDRDRVEHFAVMGGIGIDAQVMSTTHEGLKKTVKSVAYMVAVAQNLTTPPVPASVQVDGREVAHRPASLMLVGNVGEIQAGLQLFPRAAADDGLLDVILTGPRGLAGWIRFGLERVYRQLTQNVDTHQGRIVRIKVDQPLPYELDGDTIGEATLFEAEVDAQALTIMLPRRPG